MANKPFFFFFKNLDSGMMYNVYVIIVIYPQHPVKSKHRQVAIATKINEYEQQGLPKIYCRLNYTVSSNVRVVLYLNRKRGKMSN